MHFYLKRYPDIVFLLSRPYHKYIDVGEFSPTVKGCFTLRGCAGAEAHSQSQLNHVLTACNDVKTCSVDENTITSNMRAWHNDV